MKNGLYLISVWREMGFDREGVGYCWEGDGGHQQEPEKAEDRKAPGRECGQIHVHPGSREQWLMGCPEG